MLYVNDLVDNIVVAFVVVVVRVVVYNTGKKTKKKIGNQFSKTIKSENFLVNEVDCED